MIWGIHGCFIQHVLRIAWWWRTSEEAAKKCIGCRSFKYASGEERPAEKVSSDPQIDIRYYGGAKADFVTKRAKHCLEKQSTAKMFMFHAGFNNLTGAGSINEFDGTQDEVIKCIQELTEVCRPKKMKVVICSIPPLPGGIETDAEKINQAIREETKGIGEEDVDFLDVTQAAKYL